MAGRFTVLQPQVVVLEYKATKRDFMASLKSRDKGNQLPAICAGIARAAGGESGETEDTEKALRTVDRLIFAVHEIYWCKMGAVVGAFILVAPMAGAVTATEDKWVWVLGALRLPRSVCYGLLGAAESEPFAMGQGDRTVLPLNAINPGYASIAVWKPPKNSKAAPELEIKPYIRGRDVPIGKLVQEPYQLWQAREALLGAPFRDAIAGIGATWLGADEDDDNAAPQRTRRGR